MISPAEGHTNAHPEGERATARGAGMSHTLMICSTTSNNSMEEIAEAATGPLWFQLSHRGYDITEHLVKRAEAAGFRAIVFTIDAPFPPPRNGTYAIAISAPASMGTSASCNTRLPASAAGTGNCPGKRAEVLLSLGRSWTGYGASPSCPWC